MQFFDQVTASGTRRTSDGYLVADARAARTGIQDYLGVELGRPDMPVVRVHRPESEVFAKDSLSTYPFKPATNDHPRKQVTSDTWKEVSIGQIGEGVVRDGEFVRVPLILMDKAAIADFENGKRDLSMGYSAEIVFESGVTDSGESYDAIQRNIRINHIALVDHGRAGNTRIEDSRNFGVLDHAQSLETNVGGQPMADNLRKVIIDGLSIDTTEQGAQAVEKLQRQISDSAQKLTDAEAKHAQAIADKDAEIAKKDAAIDDLKAKVLDDAAIDKRVNERADLIATAKAIHDGDYTGKSDADIRKAVVVAKLGDAAIKDKPEAYIQARFDILAEDAKADPVARAMRSTPASTTVTDNGYAESVKEFQPGYQRGDK